MNFMSEGARIPLLCPDEMSPEQKALYDAVVTGPRRRMIGPLRAAIHSPEMAVLWSQFGEFLRFRTCLPAHLNELAIIVTARRWNSQVEWWVHSRVGMEAGLSPNVVDAIQDGRHPKFADEASQEVYEFARLLQETGKVPLAVHDAVKARWGVRGVVELTAVIGYYTMVAMTLNAHGIPVPDDEAAPLREQDALFTLASAADGTGSASS